MAAASLTTNTKSKNSDIPDNSNAHAQPTRETVESIVVAFVLAFLFRAFVAEAFVIPTGSMAPTLMGAHKDIQCEHCGQQYTSNASQEFDDESVRRIGRQVVVAVASTCPSCRGTNAFNLRGNANHGTFSGDRILVSKFDYILSKPKRWDVFVFKYPLDARMNYIKRLVGLPGEELLLQEGDVYVREDETSEYEIARKPPGKILAMKQLVNDTDRRSGALIGSGWPSPWQPTRVDTSNAWTINHAADDWSAKLSAQGEQSVLRYYHKVPSPTAWDQANAGEPIEPVDKHDSQLVTDFLAYNSWVDLRFSSLYEVKPAPIYKRILRMPYELELDESVTEENRAYDQAASYYKRKIGYSVPDVEYQGYHWVGDLYAEFDIDIASEQGKLLLDVVEFGIRFQCSIDVADGTVVLSVEGDGSEALFDKPLNGQTSLRGSSSHRVAISNFDDQIVLWVDGSVVEFDQTPEFNSWNARKGRQRRPYWTEADPLDAAPIGIGGQNLEMTVTRAQVSRDIYYIAVNRMFNDFVEFSSGIVHYIPDQAERRGLSNKPLEALNKIYSHPQWWEETDLFSSRRTATFQLGEKQYFPMGDNSAQSSDARVWATPYVDEQFLLGKALLVFWPHMWNAPIPFTPNLARMGLIH